MHQNGTGVVFLLKKQRGEANFNSTCRQCEDMEIEVSLLMNARGDVLAQEQAPRWSCGHARFCKECSSHIVRVLRMQRKLKILEGWTLKCFCFNRGGREQHYKAKTEQCWDGKGD